MDQGNERLTFDAFALDVLRFESQVGKYCRASINQSALLDMLQALVQVANALDLFKKAMFYGKDVPVGTVREQLKLAAHHALDASDAVTNGPRYSANPSDSLSMRTIHALLGYVTEAGEVADALHANLRDGHPLDVVNVLEEFGDGDWYKAVFFDEHKVDSTVPWAMVMRKLAQRYGQSYNDQGALQRDLSAERALLEAPAPSAPAPDPRDILLGKALDALEYHQDQTRPIAATQETIRALREHLGGSN